MWSGQRDKVGHISEASHISDYFIYDNTITTYTQRQKSIKAYLKNASFAGLCVNSKIMGGV